MTHPAPQPELIAAEQGSSEWWAARADMVTAGDFGAAVGLSQHKTPRSLWREKTGRKRGRPRSPAIDWGRDHEPVARAAYSERFGVKVTETGLLRHPTIPWIGCSPDGIVGTDGMLEIKCPFRRHVKHKRVPAHFMPQIQGSLEILGREWCDYVTWTQARMSCFRVYRSVAYWAWLLPQLQRFRDCWEQDEEPPILGGRALCLAVVEVEVRDVPVNISTFSS